MDHLFDVIAAQWGLFQSLDIPTRIGLVTGIGSILAVVSTFAVRALHALFGKGIYLRQYVEKLEHDISQLESDNFNLKMQVDDQRQLHPRQQLERLREQLDTPLGSQKAHALAGELLPLAAEVSSYLAQYYYRDAGAPRSMNHSESLRHARICRLIGGPHGETARESVARLHAEILFQGRSELTPRQREWHLVELAEALVVAGNDASLIANEADRRLEAHDYIAAEALFKWALDTAQLDIEHTLLSQRRLVKVIRVLGRSAEALTLSEEIMPRIAAHFGENHAVTLSAKHEHAHCLQVSGRFEHSRQAFQETFEACQSALGEGAPETLSVQACYANDLLGHGEYARAKPLLEENIRLRRQYTPDDHRSRLRTQYDLACILDRLGGRGHSAELMTEVYEQGTKHLGADAPITLRAGRELAAWHIDAKRYEDARLIASTVVERMMASPELGPFSEETLMAIRRHAASLTGLGRRREAIELLERSLEPHRRLPAVTPSLVAAEFDLSHYRLDEGQVPEGVVGLRAACEKAREWFGADHFDFIRMYGLLGGVVGSLLGEHEEALRIFSEVRDIATRQLGQDSEVTLSAELNILRNSFVLDPAPQTLRELEVLAGRIKRLLGENHRLALAAESQFAVFLGKCGELEEAVRRLDAAFVTQRAAFGEHDVDTQFTGQNLRVVSQALRESRSDIRPEPSGSSNAV